MKRIAIQGLIGSFHDIAAHLYFEGEQIQLICCATFEEVFANMKNDPTMIGMLAIENTIAGSLLHNYFATLALPSLVNISFISLIASVVCLKTTGTLLLRFTLTLWL